jgi:Domain of Unknown Function (DUF1080)
MLRCNDPNCDSDSIVRFGSWPHVVVVGTVDTGQTYTFTFDENHPMIAPDTPGTYTSIWRVWQAGQLAGQNVATTFVIGTPAFLDDFQDGNAEGWSLHGFGNWFVENGEYVVDMGERKDRDGVSVAGDSN